MHWGGVNVRGGELSQTGEDADSTLTGGDAGFALKGMSGVIAGDDIQVAVLVVAYNGRHDLIDCLSSVLAADRTGLTMHVVVVDNGSTDGSADAVRARFPEVQVIVSETNRGFAGGNNFGWQSIVGEWTRLHVLALLNQDTLVDRQWLLPLVACLRDNPQVGAVQPKILLEGDESKKATRQHIAHASADSLSQSARDAPQRINTAGNRSHFLGFGYMTGYGEVDQGQYDDEAAIDFASGAALALRADLIRKSGLFDDDYGLYLEDAELGWRLRLMGFESRRIPASVVWHKYTWHAPFTHYTSLELNRWRLLMTYYRRRTLLLLSPAILAMEVGQFIFAITHGLLRQRLTVWATLARPSFWASVRKRRASIQECRQVTDRDLTRSFSGSIEFGPLKSRLFRWIGNPLMAGYWRAARRLLRW